MRLNLASGDLDDPVVTAINMQGHLATDAAIGAGGVNPFQVPAPTQAQRLFIGESARGTELNALTAVHAGRGADGQIVVKGDAGCVTAMRETNGFVDYRAVIPGNAPTTLDAFGPVKDHEFRTDIRFKPFRPGKGRLLYAQIIGHPLQFTATTLGTGKTVVMASREQQIHNHFLMVPQHRSVSADLHAVGGQQGTGGE